MKKSKLHPKLLGYMGKENQKCNVILHLTDKYFQKVTHYFPFAGLAVANVTLEEAKYLAKKTQIAYISPCVKVKTLICEAKEKINYQNLSQNKYFGKDKHLAVIDTGVHPHLDFLLKDNAIEDFCDVVNQKINPYDDNGHGTMAAGVALSRGSSSCGIFAGIAPKAKLLAIKAINAQGEASTIEVLKGIEYVFDNAIKKRIDVVNMSFGAEFLGMLDPIVIAAEKLMDKGILVVSASGNSGDGTIKSPGISRKILTVGSCENVDGNNITAAYSSGANTYFGTKPDIVTLGTDIISPSIEGEYKTFSGTSVSSAMVSGMALVLKEKLGIHDSYKLKSALIASAKTYGEKPSRQGMGAIYF